MKCDVRDISLCRATFVDDNKVLVKCPSVDAGWLGDQQLHQRSATAFHSYWQNIQDEHDITRLKLTKAPERNKKFLLLDFGEFELSNAVFNDKGNKDTEVSLIKNAYHVSNDKFTWKTKKFTKHVSKIEAVNKWMVTLKETETRLVAENVEDEDDYLNAGLAGMHF